MRNIIFIVSMFLVASLLVLSFGCSQPEPAPTPAPAPSPAPTPTPTPGTPDEGEIKDHVAFTGSPSGTVFVLNSTLAGIIDKYTPMSSSAETYAGGMPAFLRSMENGETEFLFFSPPSPMTAVTGGNEYFEEPQRLWRVASADKPAMSYFCIATTADSGIKTVKDLEGKKVYAEWPGWAPGKATILGALAANGMTVDDINYQIFSHINDVKKELLEGRAAAGVYVLGSWTQELAASPKGLYVIPMSDAEIAAIHKVNPGIEGTIVEKGYSGVQDNIQIAAAKYQLWVYPETSVATVYEVTKAFYEHLDEFQPVHKVCAGFTLDNALESWPTVMHPGAIKYFQEIGAWEPEHTAKMKELLQEEKDRLGSLIMEDWFRHLGVWD